VVATARRRRRGGGGAKSQLTVAAVVSFHSSALSVIRKSGLIKRNAQTVRNRLHAVQLFLFQK